MPSKFSGEKGQSALRWLRTLKYELPGDLTSNQWLEYVDGLLEGEGQEDDEGRVLEGWR